MSNTNADLTPPEGRALPIRPGLRHLETPQSYLRRLAAANGLSHACTEAVLRSVRGPGDKAGKRRHEAIRLLGDLPPQAFTNVGTTHLDGSRCVKCMLGHTERTMCRLCSCGEEIQQAGHLGHYVCQRHRVWTGPGASHAEQTPVSPELAAADRKLSKLIRSKHVDAPLIIEVQQCLEESCNAGNTQIQPDLFIAMVALLAQVTSRQFNDLLLDARKTYKESYQVLHDLAFRTTGSRATGLTDNLWSLYRPVFWRRQQSQLGEPIPPLRPHQFNPSFTSRTSPRPLQPFWRYNEVAVAQGLSVRTLKWQLAYVDGSQTRQGVRADSHQPSAAICENGHAHETTPAVLQRALDRGFSGCPVCRGTSVQPRQNSLMVLRPWIAQFFSADLNDGVTPWIIHGNSNKRFWWICPSCKKPFKRTPASINHFTRCPECGIPLLGDAAETVVSLLQANPELAAELVVGPDGQPDPSKILRCSSQNYLWRCPRNPRHEWVASPMARQQVRSCPFCTDRQVLLGDNDFKARYPQLARSWDYKLNSPLRPEQFTPRSGYVASWKCNGHSYQAAINSRVKGSSCPYCQGSRPLPGYNTLRSVRPKIADEWHPCLNVLTPDQVTWGSSKEVFWICPEGHIYLMAVHKRTCKDRGCTVCRPARTAQAGERIRLRAVGDWAR